MGRKLSFLLYIAAALPILYAYSLLAKPTDAYLNCVNNACGSNYGCELCHIDPHGKGPLTDKGRGFIESGHDPSSLCPPSD